MNGCALSSVIFAIICLSHGSEVAPDRRFSELDRLLGLIDREYDNLADKKETSLGNSKSEYVRVPEGRLPDLTPCPKGLRDDGISCWSDAHIYGKGCCCTLWGCCDKCETGYHDDGCTCRKIDVGIKVTLGQRWKCHSDESLSPAGRCFPRGK